MRDSRRTKRNGSRRGRRAGALAAAVAVAAPALVAVTAGQAAAASGSLTVTALNRQGTAAHQWMDVTALDVPGAAPHELQTGYPTVLPAGRYAVVVSVWEPGNTAQTLAAQVVTVADDATTEVTVDARQGAALSVGLDSAPGADYRQGVAARVCVTGAADGLQGVAGGTETRPVYVVPNTDPLVRLGYSAAWVSPTKKDAYAATGTTALTGDPITVARAGTGTVSVRAMRGPSSLNTSTSRVDAVPQTAGCAAGLQTQGPFITLPYTRDYHVTPGAWRFDHDTWHGAVNVTAGSSSAIDFGRAVWGPARYLPWVRNGELGFFTSGMVADPQRTGADITINATATLLRDGRAVVTRTGLGNSQSAKGPKTFWAPITASGAYTLKVHGYRHATGVPQPAGMMSTATDAAFSFHAGPTSNAVPPAFLTRFLPGGLDLYNRVPAGRASTVPLLMDRTSTQAGVPMWPAAVKKVEVFGSTDGGRSWHALTVTGSGGSWAVRLPAQRSGASLSLSSRVTDTGGNQTVSTVYRAFTVIPSS